MQPHQSGQYHRPVRGYVLCVSVVFIFASVTVLSLPAVERLDEPIATKKFDAHLHACRAKQ
jgi:hypothetical protein